MRVKLGITIKINSLSCVTNTDDEERGIIASGMNEYHKSTCIRFVPRTDEDDYIQIQSISGY